MAAGVGLVGRHVADARMDRGLDFARTQAPEMPLGGAHVGTHLLFDVLGQAHDLRQAGEGLRFQAERRREPADFGLAVRLRRGDLGRGAGLLQRQQEV